MEKKIIVPNREKTAEELKEIDEQTKKWIDKLNNAASAVATDGMWCNIEGVGTVWKLNGGDMMGGVPQPPKDRPSPLLEGIVEWGKQIDVNAFPENAVLMIKIGIQDPTYATKMQYGIIKQVLEPRKEKLKEKKITVLFMSSFDDISHLTSEEMEQAGWIKKDKPLIITNY